MKENPVCSLSIPIASTVYSVYNIKTCESWGVVNLGSSIVYQGYWVEDKFTEYIPVVDIQKKRMLALYQITGDSYQEVINVKEIYSGSLLLEDGNYWIGHIYANIPCGYGTITSTDGKVYYQGFRFNTDNICYGTYYENEAKVYQGMICKNKRHGLSTFPNNPRQWINNIIPIQRAIVVSNDSSPEIHSCIDRLSIQDDSFVSVSSSFMIMCFPCIQEIVIGKRCFSSQMRQCCFINLPSLQKVIIQERSFYNVHRVQFQGWLFSL